MIFSVCDNRNIDDFTCIKHQTLAAFEQRVQAASKTMNLGNIRRETPQRQTNKPQVINTWQGATVNWENDGKQRHHQTGQENGEGANPKIWRTHWGLKWQQAKARNARKEKSETGLIDSFATNDLDWIKPHLGPSIGLHHRLQPFPNWCRSSFASRRRWLPWTRVQLQQASGPLPSRGCCLTKGIFERNLMNSRTTQNLCSFEIGCV